QMSIKQSIASLVILLSVSFSAFSQYLVIDREGNSASIAYRCTGYSRGDVVDTSNPPNVAGISWPDGSRNVACKSAYWVGSWLSVEFEYYGSKIAQIGGSYVSGCPDGQELNPDTGKCEEPPVPFCEKPDTINQMNQFKDACFDKGNGWSPEVSCSDATESLDMACNPPPPESCEPGSPSFPACLDDENKCDENHPDWNPEYGMCCTPENNWCDVPPPESCTIFSPNWPECSGDTDIDPPTGGDLGDPDKPSGGGGGGSTDPDKPEPDVDNTSDTLAAIKAMNKDVNSQLTGINNDMNKNQAETKSVLDAL
ncbi:chemotaxis protein, partial [Vibrio parahaemolyticus]|nr:chemotaxis protein [Vibrio parahaemolyticus]